MRLFGCEDEGEDDDDEVLATKVPSPLLVIGTRLVFDAYGHPVFVPVFATNEPPPGRSEDRADRSPPDILYPGLNTSSAKISATCPVSSAPEVADELSSDPKTVPGISAAPSNSACLVSDAPGASKLATKTRPVSTAPGVLAAPLNSFRGPSSKDWRPHSHGSRTCPASAAPEVPSDSSILACHVRPSRSAITATEVPTAALKLACPVSEAPEALFSSLVTRPASTAPGVNDVRSMAPDLLIHDDAQTSGPNSIVLVFTRRAPSSISRMDLHAVQQAGCVVDCGTVEISAPTVLGLYENLGIRNEEESRGELVCSPLILLPRDKPPDCLLGSWSALGSLPWDQATATRIFEFPLPRDMRSNVLDPPLLGPMS